MRMNYGTLIFLHVPKSAGTTFGAILRQQYGRNHIYKIDNEAANASVEQYKQMGINDKRQYRVIEGHWPVELHNNVIQPCTYVTFLRNPLKRVVSHYYHVLGHQIIMPMIWDLIQT